MFKISKKLVIIFSIIIVVAAVGIYFWQKNKNSVPVQTISPEKVVVKRTVSASGTVKANNNADLAFAASGRVTAVKVKKGDVVKKGETIAQLYTYPSSQSAQAAKDARDIAIRDRDLFLEDNSNDTEDFDIKLRRFNELVSKAEAAYQAELGGIRNLYIQAPFAGTILEVNKEEGEIATAGETVVKEADIENLFFEVQLDQEDYGKVRLGQEAEVELDAYGDQIFEGTIVKLPQYAEVNTDGSEEFIVDISIETTGEYFALLGMTGDASIIVEKSVTEVPAMQFDTIFTDDKGNFIWTAYDGKVHKRYVETGIEGDIYIELLDDVSQDTIVIPADSKIEIKEGLIPKYDNSSDQ